MTHAIEHSSIKPLRDAINDFPENHEAHGYTYVVATKGMIEMVSWLLVEPTKANREIARVIVRTTRKILEDLLKSRIPEDDDFYILQNIEQQVSFLYLNLFPASRKW